MSSNAKQTADKVWLASYPQGVPAEVDVRAFASVVDVLEHSVRRFAGRPAFANMGTVLSYAELDAKTRAFAAFLQSELGLRKGERIAIMMPNLLQYPVALFGALRAGLTVTNINPLYTPRELKHQLVDSGASAIVVLENFCQALSQVVAETAVKSIIVTRVGDLLGYPKSAVVNFAVKHVKHMVPAYRLSGAINFRHALRVGARGTLQPVALGGEDLAFLQYTAGTTGAAKGVMLTHGNIVANLEQTSAWIAPFTSEGRELIVTPLPLYHIFSLTANCLLYMKIGALIYLITNPRDFKRFVREIRTLRFTAITGVNTLFNALLNTPGFSSVDFSSLKIALGGGMAIQRAVAERWKAATGRPLIEAYGLTEASPGVCINPLNLDAYNGKVGLPLPSTECSVQDEAGHLLGPGKTGEICVRGPQVMAGYWGRPEQTAAALAADGWLHTGDVGVMDASGFFQILERKDDLIVVSGFNVYPSEVEQVVAEHPGVREVAAVGLADDSSGQVVGIFVVRRDPGLTEAALREYCRVRMAAYKVPKRIEFREFLPKSNIGKVLRRALH